MPIGGNDGGIFGAAHALANLAAECDKDGNPQVAEYLFGKALESERQGREVAIAVPGFTSQYGQRYSMDDDLIKALVRNAWSPSPTPFKINETLYLLGAYTGIRDPGEVMQQTHAILKAASQNVFMAGPLRLCANKATRYTTQSFHKRDKGFEIRMKDRRASVTRVVAKKIDEITDLLLHGGFYQDPAGHIRVHSQTGEPGVWDGNEEEKAFNFRDFTMAVMMDSLTMDWACYRKEPGQDRKKYPVVFFTPLASERVLRTVGKIYKPQILMDKKEGPVAFVEYGPGWSHQAIREYPWYRMGTMVRNPRVEFFTRGYGYSETEVVLDVLAAMQLGLRFIREYFDNNHIPPAIIELRGQATTMGEQPMESLRSQMMQTGGPGAYWRVLFLQFLGGQPNSGLDVKPLRGVLGAQGEMQFGMQAWTLFYNLLCSILPVTADELGFEQFRVQRASLSERSSEPQLTKGEDKFRPLMDAYAASLNENIIELVDPDFQLSWVGLEGDTEAGQVELGNKQMQIGWTANQVADYMDEPRTLHPLDPVLHAGIAKKYKEEDFDTHEEWRDKVDGLYEKECEKQHYPKAWSAAWDSPAGNPYMSQVWSSEQQEIQQAVMQAAQVRGYPQEPPENIPFEQQEGQEQPGGEQEGQQEESPNVPRGRFGQEEEEEQPPVAKAMGPRVIEVVVR